MADVHNAVPEVILQPEIDAHIQHNFYAAIRENRTNDILDMIATHPSLLESRGNPDQRTSLHVACYWGQIGIVQLFVARCPHLILVPDSNGRLPLHDAAIRSSLPLVQALVEATPVAEGNDSKEGEDRQEQIRRHVLTLANDGYPSLYSAIRHKQLPTAEFLLRCAPEAFFFAVNNCSILEAALPISIQEEMFVPIVNLGLELFGPDRIYDLIMTGATGQSLVHRVFNCGSDDAVKLLLGIAPDALTILSTRDIQWFLREGCMRAGRIYPFELMFHHAYKLGLISTKLLSRLLHLAIYGKHATIFHFLEQMGERHYGEIWTHKMIFRTEVVGLTSKEYSMFELAIRYPHASILARVITKYMKIISDPFHRGRVYFQVIDKTQHHSLFDEIEIIRDLTITKLVVEFVRALGGPKAVMNALALKKDNGWLPIHRLLTLSAIPTLEYVVGLGMPVEDIPRTETRVGQTLRQIAQHQLGSVKFLQAIVPNLIGSEGANWVPMTEEEILQIRRRTYFNSSLTSKLLFWIWKG